MITCIGVVSIRGFECLVVKLWLSTCGFRVHN